MEESKSKRAILGSRNKRLGSNIERYYAKIFRELGYSTCETSRFASKRHDNSKIDLVDIPFNIQIKAGVQKSMNPGKEMFSMESYMEKMFPKNSDVFTKPILLFHYKMAGSGKKRLPEHEIVYMSLRQFNKFKKLNTKLKFLEKKEFKFDLKSEFKTIVSMTFNYFKEEIILKHFINGINNT